MLEAEISAREVSYERRRRRGLGVEGGSTFFTSGTWETYKLLLNPLNQSFHPV